MYEFDYLRHNHRRRTGHSRILTFLETAVESNDSGISLLISSVSPKLRITLTCTNVCSVTTRYSAVLARFVEGLPCNCYEVEKTFYKEKNI